MKVKDAIALLAQCNPEAEFIVNAPYQGHKPVTVLLRRDDHGGIDGRYSYEEIITVEAVSGDFAHMRGQGMDVLGLGDPPPCKCNQCRYLRSQNP